jgi:uncharacterized integral membrane protein
MVDGRASPGYRLPMTSDSSPPVEPESTPGVGRRERARHYARRTWLYTWVTLLAIALVLLVILIAQNTRRVRVGWVFGHSRISLVFLVLFATVLGWVLGLATSILFRRQTRRGR